MTLLEHQPSLTQSVETSPAPIGLPREAWLYGLLGTDYEHAQGLVDQFAYNPETGQDALRHILSGDVVDAGNGMQLAYGFHHEPSAGPDTYVDRNHLNQFTNVKKRQDYAEKPYEPYRAQTVVGGFQKTQLNHKPDGGIEVKPAMSSMFPKEYDALTVMSSIVNARDSRDKEKDKLQTNGKIAAEGHWVMVDDKTMMRMNIILEPETEKIIAAMPRVRSHMNLTPDMIKTHLGL